MADEHLIVVLHQNGRQIIAVLCANTCQASLFIDLYRTILIQ